MDPLDKLSALLAADAAKPRRRIVPSASAPVSVTPKPAPRVAAAPDAFVAVTPTRETATAFLETLHDIDRRKVPASEIVDGKEEPLLDANGDRRYRSLSDAERRAAQTEALKRFRGVETGKRAAPLATQVESACLLARSMLAKPSPDAPPPSRGEGFVSGVFDADARRRGETLGKLNGLLEALDTETDPVQRAVLQAAIRMEQNKL